MESISYLERVFRNTMAKLSEYDCIGFDLDHTLIQYKLDNFYPVSQKSWQREYDKTNWEGGTLIINVYLFGWIAEYPLTLKHI